MIELHPEPEQLAAFRLGTLADEELAALENHIAQCDSCCRRLKNIPDDSFVSLIRKSSDSAATWDKGPVSSACGSSPGVAGTSSAEVPADLREHPRYEVLEKLGQGGMGVVYKARHRLMDRIVALKVLNPRLLDRPESVERFRREVQGAARLVHPHIVTAYDAEQAGNSHFLAMEFVPGISLDRLIDERGPLPVAEACDYIRQAALGLQHAFACGMVHRDIKPQNLMVTGGPPATVKILDFGLARFVSEVVEGAAMAADTEVAATGLTQASTVMGTPEYIAPEQAQAAHCADIRADIYSLGCTLYHLLAGHAPFPHGSTLAKIRAHVEQTARPLGELRPDVPVGLLQLIERMLAKDPARRPQQPAEVAEALIPWAGTAVRPAPPTPTSRPRRRRFAMAGVVAALLIVCTVLPPVRDLAQSVFRIVTNQGVLEIEADGEDLEITVRQGDKTAASAVVVNKRTKRSFELRAEGGEISARELPDGVRARTTRFELTRGGKTILSARMLLGNPPGLLASFGPADQPITRDGVDKDQGGWRIKADRSRTVRLFDVDKVGADECLIFFRAKLKTEDVTGKAYLEMWCNFPGQGEFFSKGLFNAVSGTTDWASYQTPFRFEKGQKVQSVKLNLVIQGKGTVWIKDITLSRVPLPPGDGPAPKAGQPSRKQVCWLDAKDSEVRDVVTNSPANTRAVVECWDATAPGGTRHDVYYLATGGAGKRVQQLEIGETQQLDLSPDGKHLAVQLGGAKKGKVSVWSVADGKPVLADFEPYPATGPSHRLVWVALIAPERLLTMAVDGQVDLWTVPERKQIFRVAPSGTGASLEFNFFGHTANNFMLSPDRKVLALWNGDGFNLHDTGTGRLLGKTERLSDEGVPLNVWGTAFSPDGKTLACSCFLLHKGAKRVRALARWSVPDGKRHGLSILPVDFIPIGEGGMTWWGPNHVVVWEANLLKGKVYDATTGVFCRLVQPNAAGKFVAHSQDGRLWCAVSEFRQGAAFLCNFDFPQQDLAGFPPAANPNRVWRVSPDGIRAAAGDDKLR